MSWEKWVLLGLLAYAVLVTVIAIGKPRQPISNGVAACTLVIAAVQAVLVVLS
jgi:hypothetical protein